MPMYQRPPFWRVPHQRRDPDDEECRFSGNRTSYHNYHKVTPGTPAGRELVRGDIIAKIDDYDARDLRHEDAQNLFKNANKEIRIVVQRDADRDGPRGTPSAPRSPLFNAAPPYRTPSPMPAPHSWTGTGKGPDSLPRTPIPPHNQLHPPYDGDFRSYMTSPLSTRTDDTFDESIQSQPYRTTPLVLPGAKVRREPGPTESYLRHHPNPSMRAPPHHDYRDTLMKQKVAESVMQRVGGDEGQKYAHKQYNSPINLYSEQNIANSVRQQTSPLPSNGYYTRPNVVKSHKPTMLYDPAKSETFRLLQEEGLGDQVQEVPIPVETKVFTAPPNKRPAPTPRPTKQVDVKTTHQFNTNETTNKQTTFVSTLHEEIQQSNSFKRLMYNVLGDAEF